MPRRRKKIETSTKQFYVKDGRKRSVVLRILEAQTRGKERLKGTVLTKPWENRHGVVVDLDPVSPPFTRGRIREARYGDGSGNRVGYTVPTLEVRRAQRRRSGKIAKQARKVQR